MRNRVVHASNLQIGDEVYGYNPDTGRTFTWMAQDVRKEQEDVVIVDTVARVHRLSPYMRVELAN